MWFGLPAEIAVRCEHCGENDWRTPVELKSGRLACFMCTRVSIVPTGAARQAAPPVGSDRPVVTAVSEIARRLATLLPTPGTGSGADGGRTPGALPAIDPGPLTQ